MVRKIFTFYINNVLLFKRPIPGPRINANCRKMNLVLWKEFGISKAYFNFLSFNTRSFEIIKPEITEPLLNKTPQF